MGRGARAATLTVVNTNDSGAGSLRQAIADAALGDTIDFSPGLSGQTITLTTGELLITKNVTLTGPAGLVTVSGNKATRVFEISGAAVNMSYLTVANGNDGNSGGGILNDSTGILILTNVTVRDSTATQLGGGIYNVNGGKLTLTSSTLSGNHADGEGGGIFDGGGEVIVAQSLISGNSSGYGGGILDDQSSMALTNSTVSGNQARVQGGGIQNSGKLTLAGSIVSGNTADVSGGGIVNLGTVTLIDSTVSHNNAWDGGGVVNGGKLTVTNSTFNGNDAAHSDGGGIFNEGGAMTVTNSTITGNHSGHAGGGISNCGGTLGLTNSTVSGNSAPSTNNPYAGGGGLFDCGTLTLTNTIVGMQTSGASCVSSGGGIVSVGYNLDWDGTCSLTSVGDLPNRDPMLNPLALNAPGGTQTQSLRPGSPAIDHIPSGVNGCGTTVSTDQRNVLRPAGGGCDVGAFELSSSNTTATPTPSPIPTPTAGPPTDTPVPTPTAMSRREKADINCDARVNGLDLLRVLKGASGLDQVDYCILAFGEAALDMDCDGQVTPRDALELAFFAMNLPWPSATPVDCVPLDRLVPVFGGK